MMTTQQREQQVKQQRTWNAAPQSKVKKLDGDVRVFWQEDFSPPLADFPRWRHHLRSLQEAQSTCVVRFAFTPM